MTDVAPFSLRLDPLSGSLEPYTTRTERRASHLRGAFLDRGALETLVEAGDPVVYEVLQHDVPEEVGQLVCCTTVLHPGTVGDEYFMTKGHYHEVRATGELYQGLSGQGYLLLMTEDGESSEIVMGPGTVAYVPPGWAHRSVNIGGEPYIFFAVYPAQAGHDYAAVERAGFPHRVVRTAAGAVVR